MRGICSKKTKKLKMMLKRWIALMMCAILLGTLCPESLMAAEPDEDVCEAEEEAVEVTEETAEETAAEATDEAEAEEVVPDDAEDIVCDTEPETVVEEEPAGDPGDSPYGLWVGIHAVTEENRLAIPGIKGGSASYDPATKTLNFKGNVTGIEDTYDDGNSLIYSKRDLKVTGSATLPRNAFYAIRVDYGSLTVEGDFSASATIGAYNAVGDLILDGNITGETWGQETLCSYTGDIIIKGGNIRVENHVKSYGAVRAGKKLIIEGGRLEATSASDDVITAGADIKITGTHSIVDPEGGMIDTCANGYFIADKYGKTIKHVIIEQTGWNVFVGDKRVTKENMSGIPLTMGSVSFDPDSSTLTFDQAVATMTATSYTPYGDELPIMCLIRSDIPIKLRGSCTLTTALNEGYLIAAKAGADIQGQFTLTGGDAGIVSEKDVTIDGEDTDIRIQNSGKRGIYVGGKLEIKEGHIESECGNAAVGAFASVEGIELAKGVTIKEPLNGKLDADKKKIVDDSDNVATKVVVGSETYNLWVGSTRVKSGNCDKIPGILGGGSAKYEPATKTLTFKGNVTGVTGRYEFYDIRVQIYCKGDLKIKGDATLTGESEFGINVVTDGALQPGALEIDGDITVSGATGAIWATDKIVTKGHINASSVNESAIRSGLGDIELTEGSLKAVTTTSKPAIYAEVGNVKIGDKARAEAQSADGTAAVEAKTNIDYNHMEVFILVPADGKVFDKAGSKIIADGDDNPASHVVVERRYYDVWVGNTQITYSNKDRIVCGTGYADFNSENDTLTFHDATEISGSYSGALVFAGSSLKIAGNANLTAKDTDEAVISVVGGDLVLQGIFDLKGAKRGIHCGGSLKIKGDDTVLTAKNSNDTMETIYAVDGFVIEGGVVNAEGGSTGISVQLRDIELLGGEVNVESKVYALLSLNGGIIDDGFIYLSPEGAHTGTDGGQTTILDGSGNVAKKVSLKRSHIHPLTHVEALEATCETVGYKEYWKCDTCRKFYEDQYGFKETTEEAVTIPAKGHTLVKHDKVEPTLTADGMKEYWECSVCKKLFADADATQEIADKNTLVIPLTTKYTVKENIKPEDSISMKVVMTASVSYNAMSHVLTTAKPSKSKANDVELLVSGNFAEYATWKVSYKNNKIVPQKETKQPGVVIQLKAKKGATKAQKKAIKTANKYLKKNPIQFKIVQADLGSFSANDVTIKLNKKQTKVTSVKIVMNGYKRTLAKKDYEAVINANGTVTLKGKRYFTGQITK